MFETIGRLRRKLRFRLHRERLRSELAEEIELHSALKIEEHTARGMPPAQAAAQARRDMGNITLAAEQSDDVSSFRSLEQFFQDVRYALRTFRKSPSFTLVAVLSLALGIAGTTAVSSIVNALLIRPLPFPQPERLVRITWVYPKAILVHFQQRCRTMDVASIGSGSEMNVTGQGPAFRITAAAASANLFSVLGAPVKLGRAFEPDEDRPGRDRVAILSHDLWVRQFGSDPGVIGRIVTINETDRRIIGVMPAGFAFPSARVQLWFPARLNPAVLEEYWAGEFTPLIGRLRPGATIEQAKREIHALAAPVWSMFPFPMPRNWGAAETTVIDLQTDLAGDARGRLLMLLGAVGAVLIIACANVAALLVARAIARRKEIALRAALGAGRSRIVRQLLTESVVLAAVAGAAGLALSAFALTLFRSAIPPEIPGASNIRIDWTAAAIAGALSLAAGLLFGTAPALGASRLNLLEALKTGGRRSASTGTANFRSWLIAGEIALTLVLVTGAGLLIRSLYALSTVNPGFTTRRVLATKISPNPSFCAQRASCIAFYRRLLDDARALPGVVDATLANTVPLDGSMPALAVDVEGHPKSADFPAPMFWTGAVAPGYLRLMEIPLLAGRDFTAADTPESEPVLLIAASTAHRFWPGENPLGKHVKVVWEERWRTVVGVVADVRQYNLANRTPDFLSGAIYMPYAQAVQDDRRIPAGMNLIVKTAGVAPRASDDLYRLAASANPNIPVGKVVRLDRLAGESISDLRTTTWILLSFAAVALILATIGIYGLVSYTVTQRTYEISLRMAIGATNGSIVRMILGQGLRVALAGMAAGLLAALFLTRALTALLFDTAPADPLIYACVSAFLFAVALAASLIPAWRASRVDPIRTLRAE